MGIRMNGLASGFDQKLIDNLVNVQRIPVENAKKRKENLTIESKEIEKIKKLLGDFAQTLNGLKSRSDFYRLKVESSHPDIVEGIVESTAMAGSYELEIRRLAKTEKELAYGFPDKDKTFTGFGYMLIEREDQEEVEIIIQPESTLQDVVRQINDSDAGVRAMIIDTKHKPDPFRLLVISEKSGKEAKITIDEDTTFLEFKEQVTGRNLDALFEDVAVTDDDNTLEGLIEGVALHVKRAEAGTKINIQIVHDLDATVESIKNFVDKYNEMIDFIHQQQVENPETKKRGVLAGDRSIKSILRQLQLSIVQGSVGGKYHILAEVGIKTDGKTGRLIMNQEELRSKLSEDYDSVANLFIQTKNNPGIAKRIGDKVRGLQDPGHGVIATRLKTVSRIMSRQDKTIEQQQRLFEKREAMIRKRFVSLENHLANMQTQGNFLAQKFGGVSTSQKVG